MAPKPFDEQAPAAEGLSQGEAIAVALAVSWMVIVGLFFWLIPSLASPSQDMDGLRTVLMLTVVFLPPGMIWVAAIAARSSQDLRAKYARLRADHDGLWQLHQALQARVQIQTAPSKVAKAPAAPPDAQPAPTSGFATRREVSRLIVPRAAPQMPADQPALALDAPVEDIAPLLERADLIKALNFPNDENDTAGFAALRRALRDRIARRLVQASQDVLTLLSQDGVYTDDLQPKPVDPDLWRRFATGERGRSVEQLGAVRDQEAISTVSRRMRADTIFRDAVHHFLRRFDQMIVTFEEEATDTDLLALAETRTARAFMLLGRATGTFD